MATITCEQLTSASFPHPTGDISVRETHLSLVVLTGDFAYKIKKAVKLDFIDTQSLERRRELCEEELQLNRRYTQDLYLGVLPIVCKAGKLYFGAMDDAIEYAVQMRQFDPAEELQALLHSRSVSEEELAALAERIAAFHAAANVLREPELTGTRSFMRKARDNLASVARRARFIEADDDVSQLRSWTEEVFSTELMQLENRERHGFIRECHGDLHSGNVMRWRGELLPFDCIEFDRELRFIDVLSDVAFLVMDLVAKERSDLAFTFLGRYLERTTDYAGIAVLPYYLVYRALVRTKVELITAEQQPNMSDARDRARSFLHVASTFAKPDPPLLVVMHGASGSGKSWLSGQLVRSIPAVRIRSDLERKRLAGMDPFDRSATPGRDIYTLEFNDETYAHLLKCARDCLRGGVNVVVDAAFLKTRERRDFQALANSERARFLIISCHADPATLASRIERRRAARNDPSDADESVMRRQLETMEPLQSDELALVLRIDTRSPEALQHTLERIRQL